MASDLDIKLSYEVNLSVPKDKEDYVRNALHKFNIEKVGKEAVYSVFATNTAGEVIGGVLVTAEKSSIFIDILWVLDSFRNKGVGSKLLTYAENEALTRNIITSTTDTFEFQAVGFYLKNGYQKIGVIENYLEGYDRIFFRKQLSEQPNTTT